MPSGSVKSVIISVQNAHASRKDKRGKEVTVIDVNMMRDLAIRLSGLTKINDLYTFYYDETNNIRRLHITDKGFNVGDPMCFVLGGVVHRGATRPLDVDGLKQKIRLQVTAKELKLAHLGKGGILQLLASPKIRLFLDWLIEEGLFVHYFALDPLYWSIVDIIDSIVTHDTLAHLQQFNRDLKDSLFTVLAEDMDDVAALFHRFGYPNVEPASRRLFLNELLCRVKDREDLLEGFNFHLLKGVLEASVSIESLIYLEDQTPYALINSFTEFYINRICLFKNSRHLLDVEEVVKTRMRGMSFRDGNKDLDNFLFVDSQNEFGVQVSDALVGLLGKLFSYITRTNHAQIIQDRNALTATQLETLDKLNALLDRSADEAVAFLEQVISLSSIRGAHFFLEGH